LQALQVDPQEKRTVKLVAAIDELFSIEALCARRCCASNPAIPGNVRPRRDPGWRRSRIWLWKPEKRRCTQPLSRRLRLSAQTLEWAHLLSATRPAGTGDQSGQKCDPPHSTWSQELDATGVRERAGPRIAAI